MLLIKALHIISVISWMAGLLYLPRLFVYHADCTDTAGRERFTLMEKRLYYAISTPAMILTLIFGLLLIRYSGGGWLAVKLLLVGLLIAFHISLFFYIKKLTTSSHPSARFFRFYNEVPTLLMIAIVLLAVTKPF
ncbi:MAG: CopD family protein [Proteobacteria bacterium]|nr:CopD family protein [Pseudomonadota bacterium]MCH9757694.1 CopD family protein [Pseudomonadota bacterium]